MSVSLPYGNRYTGKSRSSYGGIIPNPFSTLRVKASASSVLISNVQREIEVRAILGLVDVRCVCITTQRLSVPANL